MKAEGDALAGDWGRTNEEAGLALPRDEDRLSLRCRCAEVYEHDDCRSCAHRGNCVHDNAQLAVIGIGLVGVQVSDLGNGQERQQDKA